MPKGRLSCSCTGNHMRPEVEKKERKPMLGTEVAVRKKGAWWEQSNRMVTGAWDLNEIVTLLQPTGLPIQWEK